MCLEWNSRHTESVIVSYILPLVSAVDHLATWEQPQESASLEMAANVFFSVPYVVVQCLGEMDGCKDSLHPV